MATKHQQAGVTMMELMVVVAIAAILAAVAVPSFNGFINQTAQDSTVSQLVSDMNRARSEAIKRNTRMLICVRDAAGTDCGNGTNWQNGWLICYDTNEDGTCDTTAPPDGSASNPIVVHQALGAKLTLTGLANLIRFNPNGTQGGGTASTLAVGGTWAGATAKTINIAPTGHIAKP
ncbi:MAG: GspH/FimT family protein [Gallionella sp.]|jgi:type IV fimbrial biogenesis protein FimT